MAHLKKKKIYTRAIMLRRVEYAESDLIVDLLTRDEGVISCIARSARKSRKRFQGCTDYFILMDVCITDTGTSGLAYLDQTKLVESWSEVSSDIRRYAYASGIIEIVQKMTPHRQQDPELFRITCEALDALARQRMSTGLTLKHDLRLLGALGFAPRMDECASCGTKAPDEARAGFDPARGILCSKCVKGTSRISGGVRECLMKVPDCDFNEESIDSMFEESVLIEARRTLDEFITYQCQGLLVSRSIMDSET